MPLGVLFAGASPGWQRPVSTGGRPVRSRAACRYPSRPGECGGSSLLPIPYRTDPCWVPFGLSRQTRSPAAAANRSPRSDSPAPSSPRSHRSQSNVLYSCPQTPQAVFFLLSLQNHNPSSMFSKHTPYPPARFKSWKAIRILQSLLHGHSRMMSLSRNSRAALGLV
jgi:hypothetical protein